MTTPMPIEQRIKNQALDLGFSDVRLGTPIDNTEKLQAWLAKNYHGTMDWMEEKALIRANPKAMWPEVESIVAVGLNYGPDVDPLEHLNFPDRGNISVYARGDDYHDVLKKKLKALGRWMAEETGCELKVFVDTAPVMEKPLAAQAGLGWQGKHTNLVSRQFGSWLFLGIIYTTLKLTPDEAEVDHCGSCRRCLDACPTNAFPAPYQMDARRCISYLTIEHKGPVPEEFRPLLGNRIYGCDDCLAACPWNKFAQTAHEIKLHAQPHRVGRPLDELAQLDDTAFREMFRKSPIKRIGRGRFVRNVLYAMGNSKNGAYIPQVTHLQNDPDPVVADAASWALSQLQ